MYCLNFRQLYAIKACASGRQEGVQTGRIAHHFDLLAHLGIDQDLCNIGKNFQMLLRIVLRNQKADDEAHWRAIWRVEAYGRAQTQERRLGLL